MCVKIKMVAEDKGDMVISLKKPNPLKKRYWKVHDIFVKEFNWPNQMFHLRKKDRVNIKIDYRSPFKETIRMLKKRFELSDKEVKSLNNHQLEYDVLRLEKTGYKDEKIISQIYKEIYNKETLGLFIDKIEYILKNIEKWNTKLNMEEYHSHKALINSTLGICFEYTCKALVLSKGYHINEHNKSKKPIKRLTKKTQLNPRRTFSLKIIWNFILEKRFIKLSKKEKMIGNYLYFLRNLCAHIPLPLASKMNYNHLSIDLIKKMIVESRKEYYKYLICEKVF